VSEGFAAVLASANYKIILVMAPGNTVAALVGTVSALAGTGVADTKLDAVRDVASVLSVYTNLIRRGYPRENYQPFLYIIGD
jgi:hypothetical protein